MERTSRRELLARLKPFLKRAKQALQVEKKELSKRLRGIEKRLRSAELASPARSTAASLKRRLAAFEGKPAPKTKRATKAKRKTKAKPKGSKGKGRPAQPTPGNPTGPGKSNLQPFDEGRFVANVRAWWPYAERKPGDSARVFLRSLFDVGEPWGDLPGTGTRWERFGQALVAAKRRGIALTRWDMTTDTPKRERNAVPIYRPDGSLTNEVHLLVVPF